MTAAIGLLRQVGIEQPERDVRLLMAAALEIQADRLTLHAPDPLPISVNTRFQELVSRRQRREPVSKILGRREFWGRSFLVSPDVLDPRPETELIIRLALDAPFQTVLDLGTGSGCLLTSLLAENSDATGCGVDVSEMALQIAANNADVHEVAERARFKQSDWWSNVQGQYDLIVANPPYIALQEMSDLAVEVLNHDPHIALTDDHDGLTAYRQIAGRAAEFLSTKGRILVEIGPSQAGAVCKLFKDSGLKDIQVFQDFDGRDRVIHARNSN